MTTAVTVALWAKAKVNACCVKSPASGLLSATGPNDFNDMTNFITEIPEVGVQLLEWRVTLYLYACTPIYTGVGKGLPTLTSHPTMDEPRGFKPRNTNTQQRNDSVFRPKLFN